jgi:hypothetical protein
MASRIVDNMIALRLLYKLVTPFDNTDAFKLGIIDAHGKVLRPASSLKTDQEKDAYNYLDRLIFNIKRLVNKLPGGESKLKNLTAAYFMVREKVEGRSSYINEKQFIALVEKLENVTLVEEEIAVLDMLDETKRMSAAARLQRAFEREKEKRERSERLGRELLNPPKKEPIKEDGEGGIMPANHTGVTVSTDQPKIYPKKKTKGVIGLARRPKPIGAI